MGVVSSSPRLKHFVWITFIVCRSYVHASCCIQSVADEEVSGYSFSTCRIRHFGAFDWYVVIKPQKGKEFKNLLVDGYHITSECEGIPGTSEMPDWMRDQSTKWQATAEQTISEKLDYKDLQMWRDTIIIGLVADK